MMMMMMMIISFVVDKKSLEKLIPNYQSCYKILFKLFNLIVTCFCWVLVKNPENVSALQSAFFYDGA